MMCKVVLYVQIVTLASTTFILTAMSVDRYLAICHPLQHRRNDLDDSDLDRNDLDRNNLDNNDVDISDLASRDLDSSDLDSVDRYLAICHPLQRACKPKLMIVVSWLAALVFATPQLFIFKQVSYDGRSQRR